MPTDWAAKVRDAITNLETNIGRVLEPDLSLALIDNVVAGKFIAGDLATIHGIPQEWISTTLGHITRAVGTGRVRPLEAGGWYAFQGMNTLTRWLPVSPPPGGRCVAYRNVSTYPGAACSIYRFAKRFENDICQIGSNIPGTD
jgi:hypothetical protein